MKYSHQLFAILFLVALPFSSWSAVEKVSISGYYQKKNLFIQNQLGTDGFGYAIRNIYINGDLYHIDHNTRAIEIDFENMGIKKGMPIEVLVDYDGATPRFLNPQSILPESVCDFQEVKTKDNNIMFSTTGESGSLNFYIEHYRWNKWISVGEVKGEGSPSLNHYSFKVKPNSGENIYRVAQLKHNGTKNISPIITIDGPQEPVTFTKNGNEISFSRPTFFEVHDVYGNLLKKGFDQKITINAKDGIAIYLSYDNSTELVKK